MHLIDSYRRRLETLLRPHRRHLRPESAQYNQDVITSTCFWRNEAQLRVFYTRIAPHIAANLDRPLRVAIHAGSIGCEAISLRIAEQYYGFNHPIELFSFDIDKQAIATARRGVFAETWFRDPGDYTRWLIPQKLVDKHFTLINEHQWRVDQDMLRSIHFEVCDMTDADALNKFGVFDVIACQNALLHLTRDAGADSLGNLRKNLQPGGVLLLGGTHPDRLADLTLACGLSPIAMDDRAVYEGWSNRLSLWQRNPHDHLGLEPMVEDAAGMRRYSHAFVRDEDLARWTEPATLAA